MKFDDKCARYWICRGLEELFGFSPNPDSIDFFHFYGITDFLSAKFKIRESVYDVHIDVNWRGRYVSCRLGLKGFGFKEVTMQRYDIYGNSNLGEYDISSHDYFKGKG